MPYTNGNVISLTEARQQRGRTADTRGREAESQAEAALQKNGWSILARRLRTPHGEIDLVAQHDGVVAFIEVKARPTLQAAAFALDRRQQRRLIAAAELILAEHPSWGPNGARFDVILVDAAGQVRRLANAFDAQAA